MKILKIIVVVFFLYLVQRDISAQTPVPESPVPSSARDSVATQKRPPVIESQDLILIEDENEESILKSDPPSPATTIVQPSNGDTLQQKDSAAAMQQTAPVVTDSAAQIMQPAQSADKDSSATGTQNQNKGHEVVVEQEKSINFANNLKQYRSPRRALFMSLLLPGLGQAYARNSWKSALFGLADAAFIGFSVKKVFDGRRYQKDADKFADAHYSSTKFIQFYDNLYTMIRAKDTSKTGQNTNDKMISIFGESRDGLQNVANKSDLYRQAKEESFTQGWDDCEPAFGPLGFIITDSSRYKIYNKNEPWYVVMYNSGNPTPVSGPIFGYSPNQNQYRKIIIKSTDQYDVSRLFIFFMIGNHIASAVDAFITARAYNYRLLEKESVWNHINLDPAISFNGFDLQSNLCLTVRF